MRASEYPVPDYAAYVWHRGDGLVIALPDTDAAGNGQTLFIPLEKLDAGTSPGWKFLLHTLAIRRNILQKGERPKFATDAKPTQEMLQHALKVSQSLRAASVVDEDIFAEETTT